MAKKVKDIENQLTAAEAELLEADTKMAEAEQELGAVKQLAAEGTVTNTIGQLAERMALVLGSHMEAGAVQGLI